MQKGRLLGVKGRFTTRERPFCSERMGHVLGADALFPSWEYFFPGQAVIFRRPSRKHYTNSVAGLLFLLSKLCEVLEADVAPLSSVLHLMLQAFVDLTPALFVDEMAHFVVPG